MKISYQLNIHWKYKPAQVSHTFHILMISKLTGDSKASTGMYSVHTI